MPSYLNFQNANTYFPFACLLLLWSQAHLRAWFSAARRAQFVARVSGAGVAHGLHLCCQRFSNTAIGCGQIANDTA